MKNPKWHRDEVILLVDTYFKLNHQISAHNSKVIELSEDLRKLDIHQNIADEATFRNPSGVSMKLANLMALDPDYDGEGLSGFSQLDKEVFEEFYDDRERLQIISKNIRGKINATLNFFESIENTGL